MSGPRRPAGGSLTGLIDFGDSYVSHQAPWTSTGGPTRPTGSTLREGYLAGLVPTADFDAAARVAMISTDLAVVASRPELAQAAAADLAIRRS